MSVTVIPAPLVSEGSGADRAALVGGLTELAAFLVTHPDVPLPGIGGRVILTIPVPQGPEWPRGRRLEALDEIAVRLGVQVVKRHGTLYAERDFAGVLLQAHVNDADYIPELLKAAGQRAPQDVIPMGGSAPEDAPADDGGLVECVTCGRRRPVPEMDMTAMISYQPGSRRGTPRPTCRDTQGCTKWAFANGRVA